LARDIFMHLSPYVYNTILRPKFTIKKYTKKVIEEVFKLEGRKVLDFGSGTGSNAFLFGPKEYLGVDIVKDRIKFAKKRNPNHSFKLIKNNKILVKDKSIDFICIFATIHHIPNNDFKKYLKEFKRILKNDGQIIVIEPVISEHKFSNFFMNFFDEGKYIRPEEEYLKLFKKDFITQVHKRYRKGYFYTELFFSAKKK